MATTQKFASTCFFLLLCLSFSFAHRVLLNDRKIKTDCVGVINNDKEKIDSVDVINNDKEKIDRVDMMIEKAVGNGSWTGTGFGSGGTRFGSENGTGSAGGMGTGTGSAISNASAIEMDAAPPLNGGEIEFMPMPEKPGSGSSNDSNLPFGEDGSHV